MYIYNTRVVFYSKYKEKIIIHHFHKYLDITQHICGFLDLEPKSHPKSPKNPLYPSLEAHLPRASMEEKTQVGHMHRTTNGDFSYLKAARFQVLGGFPVSSFIPQPKICTHQIGSLKIPPKEMNGG